MFPIIVTGLLAAILGVVGYKLSLRQDQMADITLPVSTCSPELQACSVALPDGRQLDFSIEPRLIKALQPMHLKVAIEGAEVESVDVDFNGAEMDMGYNRTRLAKGQQGFSGQAMLPVCVTGTMIWTATVLLGTPKQRVAIPFHFSVTGR